MPTPSIPLQRLPQPRVGASPMRSPFRFPTAAAPYTAGRGSVMAPMPVMAPDASAQMLDEGNSALESQGLPAYQPQQNMIFPSTNAQGQQTFMGRHPGLAGALEGALLTASNMPSTGPVASTGDGIAAAARGFLGMVGQKRQFALQQAMLPMQMAQQVAQMKAATAPQAMSTPAGIVMRDPLTGQLSHGASLAEIAGQGQTPSFDEASVMGMVPDANPQEQLRLRAAARVAQSIISPDKKAEYIGNAIKQISDDRFHQQQHDDTMGMQQQFHDDSMAMQQQNHSDSLRMQQQGIDLKRLTMGMMQNRQNDTILNHSYEFNANKLDKVYQPLVQFNQRLSRLNDNINVATPQADALLAPELMTVVAGGQGTGLRLNEAEIARAVGGRSKWQNLKAALQQWSTDPAHANSITPEQRQQMKQIIDMVSSRSGAAMNVLDSARQQLINAPDVQTHRQIVNDAMTGVNNAYLGALPQNAPQANTGGLQIIRDANGRIIGVK